MEDNSFIKLTEEGTLEKINIDSRLVDSFKSVMKKIQDYFNANGYTSQRNYKEYLEKFLLNSGDKNMRIYVDKIESIFLGGFYDKLEHEICINENILNSKQENLDSTLCHEFIHFLVMHDLQEGKAEPEIMNGGFVNEALTEMITQQMYPESNAYDAQVSMQKFANLVSGNTNNFSRFLQGFIDARYSSPDWENYREYTNKFQNDFNKAGYISLKQAQSNNNFIEAQRKLISLFIRPYGNKSIEEYIDSISKLIDRPVQDSEYINNRIISQLDRKLISSLKLKDENLEQVLQQKLTELRNQIANLKQYGGKKIYEFEFEGRKFTLDDENDLHGNLIGASRSWNPRKGIMILNINGKELSLNVNEIEFEEASQRIKELSSYFNKEASKDLSFIGQASKEQGDLTKIEKFTIPVLDAKTKQKNITIYLATYKDKIVILNNASKISDIEHMDLNKYIGITSTDLKTAAIYANKIGSIEKGTMYSILSDEAVKNRAINIYAKQLQNSLSQEQLNSAVQLYKTSEDFIDDTEENIKDEAIRLLAEERFGSISDEKRNELFEIVKNQNTKFIISTEDGKIDVSYVFGDKYQTAYKGSCEVLYDSTSTGKYNELYDSISKNVIYKNTSSKQFLTIDKEGNIIFQAQQSQEREKNKEYLIRTYEKSEINQEDLDKVYGTLNRTKENTQDNTYDFERK